jgi:hypothetical protein
MWAPVTNRVNTWVDPVEPPGPQAVVDRVRAKTEVKQLPSRDVAALTGRHLRDREVNWR